MASDRGSCAPLSSTGARARWRRLGQFALLLTFLVIFAVPGGFILGQQGPGARGRLPAPQPLQTSWARNPITGRLDECAAGEVLVQFKPATIRAARDDVHLRVGTRLVERIPQVSVERVACADGQTVEDAISAYRQRPEVAVAEPNWIMRALEDGRAEPGVRGDALLPAGTRLLPNDPRFAEQYGLASVQAPAAWDTQTGSPSVVIAVVDTGVNLTHEDLQANIWQNLDEIAGNGIDDDGNGKVDDRFGWDFVDNDNNPDAQDNYGNGDKHGTHVAGIAAAIGNNGVGVAGVVWHCKIMSVRVLNSTGNGTTAGVINGTVYAADNGASVINLSIGGGYAASMQTGMDYAYSHGAVLCVALGNDGEEIGVSTSTWHSPVCNDGVLGVDNKVLGVAAVDRYDAKPGWSNYSSAYSFCDVNAPGVDIVSTWWPTGYGTTSGTSMATPYVAGLAAMLRSQFPTETNAQIMARIRGSTDNIDAVNPAVAGKLGTGRINAYNALQPPHPGPLAYVQHHVDDDNQGTSQGDGDFLVEPGESIELKVTIRNQGMLQANNARATLSTTTSGITITDNIEYFANVPAFATAETLDDFDFTVAPTVPLGSIIAFDLTAEADNGGPWVSHFTVRAGRGPSGEPDDTCVQAAQVPTNGTPTLRYFEVAGDHDWMKFSAKAGATYVVETSELSGSSESSQTGLTWAERKAAAGTGPAGATIGRIGAKDMQALAVDTVMRLVDVNCGTQLAYDDDSGQGFASRIEWTAPANGMYSVEVWDFKGNTGTYTFTVTELVPGPVEYLSHAISDDGVGASQGDGDGIIDPGETVELSVTVKNQGTVVGNVQGTLSTTTAGITVTRATEGFGSLAYGATGTTAEPFVFTVDPELAAGTPIAFALTVSASGAGPWVSHFQTVVGRDEFGEPDDSCAIAVEVPADGTVMNRRFEVVGDHDWIKFQAAAGTTYIIETGNLGSLEAGKAAPPAGMKTRAQAAAADTFLRLVDTDCQTTLATNDDISFPDNLASRIEWTAPVSGAYYAEITCWADSCTGTYTAKVTGQLSSITGRVATAGGTGVQGVVVTADLGSGGASAETRSGTNRAGEEPPSSRDMSWEATTGSDGTYSITGLPAGAYTLTPSHANYAFSPLSRAATIPPAAVGMDFTATPWPGIVIDADPSTPGTYEEQVTGRTGAEVDVDVVATVVTNLKAYDFKLVCLPDKLAVVSVTEGPFLGSLGGTTSFAADLSTPGEAHITNSLATTDPAIAPDGAGVIAHVRLQVLARDTCAALSLAEATFTDVQGTDRAPVAGTGQVCGEVHGDYDGDHDVDVDDLALMRAHWGGTRSAGSGADVSRSCQPYDERFDEDGDGYIGFADFFAIWRDNPTVHTQWTEGDLTGDQAVTGCGEKGYPMAGPDDFVDIWDLLAFAARWQTQAGGPGWEPVFDFAGPGGVAPPSAPATPVDGIVNIHDLLVLAANWHMGGGPAPPGAEELASAAEPASLVRKADAGGQAGIRLADDVVVAGDEVHADVVASGQTRLSGYDVQLSYDSRALELERIDVGDVLGVESSAARRFESVAPGRGTVAGAGAAGVYMADVRSPGLVLLTGAAIPSASAADTRVGEVIAGLTFRARKLDGPTTLAVKSARVWGNGDGPVLLDGATAPLRVVTMGDGDWRAEVVVKSAGQTIAGHYLGVLRAAAEPGQAASAPSASASVAGGSRENAAAAAAGSMPALVLPDRLDAPLLGLRFERDGAWASSDYRAADAHGMQYAFDVSAAAPGEDVAILLPDLSQVPRRYRLLLSDVAAGTTVSLRTQTTYRYTSPARAPGGTRRFVLDVADDNSGSLTITGLTVLPVRGNGVQIAYELSGSAAVSVDILNVAGVRIRRLEQQSVKTAGRQVSFWDERSERGTVVPSGRYLVRVQARGDASPGTGRGAGVARAVGVISVGR